MSLAPSKDTIADAIPVIAKVFELFTGGFSLVSTTLRDGVTLPAGSMMEISESTRQATPVKTAKMVSNATATQLNYLVEDGSYFKAGDLITREDGSAAHVQTVTASGSYDQISVSTSIGSAGGPAAIAATGTILYKASAAGGEVLSGTADAITIYDIEVGDTSLSEGVTLLRRGTVYKNRMQPHLAGHIGSLPATIQLSESY